MKLKDLQRSQSAIITSFGNLSPAFANRLQDLGFDINERITCVNRLAFGAPCVYQVGSDVFSLDSNLSSQIEVKA